MENKTIVLPHSSIDEMCLLALTFHSIQNLKDTLEILSPEDFYHPQHQIIFRHMQSLVFTQSDIDVLMIASSLESEGMLHKIGGREYLLTILSYRSSANDISYYAEKIKTKSINRKIHYTCARASEKAITDPSDIHEFLEEIKTDLHSLTDKKDHGTSVEKLIAQEIPYFKNRMDEFKRNGFLAYRGTKTGLTHLDSLIGGLGNSNLVIVAARPGIGKTCLALTIAQNVADKGGAVGFFSLEMQPYQLLERMLSFETKISPRKYIEGNLTEKEQQQHLLACESLKTKKILIDSTNQLSLILSRARRWKETYDIQLLVVDYLGRVQSPSNKNQTTADRIAFITGSLKNLAMDLDIPVLCLCQFNREGESNPTLANLRDSGAVEQDADVVIFIKREKQNSEVADLTVAKNRHGESGEIRVSFEFAKFVDYVPIQHKLPDFLL